MDNNNIRETKSDKLRPGILPTVLILLSLLFTSSYVLAANKKIVITQIVEHPSLEQAKKGILDELKSAGFEAGKNLDIIELHAQGSIATARVIAKSLAGMELDAIVPISTSSAQSVVAATRELDIPIVFSSVTDPVAAGLVSSLESTNERVSGAIDFPPIKEEINLIKSIIPNIKTLGVLYNSGEANSVKTIELLKQSLGGGIKLVEVAVNNSGEAAVALKGLSGRVEAVYIPSDNTVFAAIPKLVRVSREIKLPIFSSDPDSVRHGFLACTGYTQYEVGRAAGKILVRVLNGERSITIEAPEKFKILINSETAETLGVKVPDIFKNNME